MEEREVLFYLFKLRTSIDFTPDGIPGGKSGDEIVR
jgi:hypothetical protein